MTFERGWCCRDEVRAAARSRCVSRRFKMGRDVAWSGEQLPRHSPQGFLGRRRPGSPRSPCGRDCSDGDRGALSNSPAHHRLAHLSHTSLLKEAEPCERQRRNSPSVSSSAWIHEATKALQRAHRHLEVTGVTPLRLMSEPGRLAPTAAPAPPGSLHTGPVRIDPSLEGIERFIEGTP